MWSVLHRDWQTPARWRGWDPPAYLGTCNKQFSIYRLQPAWISCPQHYISKYLLPVSTYIWSSMTSTTSRRLSNLELCWRKNSTGTSTYGCTAVATISGAIPNTWNIVPFLLFTYTGTVSGAVQNIPSFRSATWSTVLHGVLIWVCRFGASYLICVLYALSLIWMDTCTEYIETFKPTASCSPACHHLPLPRKVF